MTNIAPSHWTATNLTGATVCVGEPIAIMGGWFFWEHPKYGDMEPLLATKSRGINTTVYTTNDHDLPDVSDLIY